jgi:hypothetical protein
MLGLASTPFLSHVIKARLLQVVWGHHDVKFNVGFEGQKPRLG